MVKRIIICEQKATRAYLMTYLIYKINLEFDSTFQNEKFGTILCVCEGINFSSLKVAISLQYMQF